MAIDTAGGLGVPPPGPTCHGNCDRTPPVRRHDKSYRKFSSAWFRVGNFLTSVWQSTHVNRLPCMESLKACGSTCKLTGLPADVVGQSGVTVARKAIVRRRLQFDLLHHVCIQAKKEEESNSRRNLFPKCLREHALPHRSFPLQPVDCTASAAPGHPRMRMTNSLISVSFNGSP